MITGGVGGRRLGNRDANARLPLFPLGTVLFPGMLLPLHVFEERYRQLVRDLLVAPHESRAFGVVAIREGREVGADGVRALHGVGCVARLRRVEPYDDGRFDVVTSGSQRFRLVALDDSRPYLQGDVELLGEPDGERAADLAPGSRRPTPTTGRRSGLRRRSSADDARALSYSVAAGAVLDLTDKQRLLEVPDTASRLPPSWLLLRRETTLLGVLPSLPAVELTRAPREPELSAKSCPRRRDAGHRGPGRGRRRGHPAPVRARWRAPRRTAPRPPTPWACRTTRSSRPSWPGSTAGWSPRWSR